MKVFAVYPAQDHKEAICLLGDVSVVPDHHPFFIPDFDGAFVAFPSVCIRIGRVGKSIAPRFAGRYVDAAATGVLYMAATLRESLSAAGLPWTEAVAFDGSAPCGAWAKCTMEELRNMKFRFFLEESDGAGDVLASAPVREIMRIKGSALEPLITATLVRLSAAITLKTGDIICFALLPEGIPLKREMRLTALTGEIPTLSARIR